jgi:hypothetical protein
MFFSRFDPFLMDLHTLFFNLVMSNFWESVNTTIADLKPEGRARGVILTFAYLNFIKFKVNDQHSASSNTIILYPILQH